MLECNLERLILEWLDPLLLKPLKAGFFIPSGYFLELLPLLINLAFDPFNLSFKGYQGGISLFL